MTDMTEAGRKAFEASFQDKADLDRRVDGSYINWSTDDLWNGWQAAITHAHGKQEPVAWMHPHGAIWRFDNCPNDVDLHDGEWRPLYTYPPAESEEVARLQVALNLAANRLHRISIEEFPLKADAHDWYNEARAALAASPAPVVDTPAQEIVKWVELDGNTLKPRLSVPDGQTPLDDHLHHPLLDVFQEGVRARNRGTGSPYHGHSLEHCIHACGWVQQDLRIALARTYPTLGQLNGWPLGVRVRKKSGSWWQGIVVGTYTTKQTPEGYCVQLGQPNGPVQIYPRSALEIIAD